MKKLLLFLVFLVSLVSLGHAQSIPAGLIYQAGAAAGIDYINPLSGQAIINQKSALNWHKIAGQVLGDAPLGVLIGGLAKVIPVSAPIEIALGGFHAYYDQSIAPLVAQGAPNPNDIPPVLQMTASMSPSAAGCAEASIYAAKAPPTVALTINGLSVSYAYQGVAVLKHIDGSRLKQFSVVDVLVCLPGTIVLPTSPVSPGAKPAASPKTASSDPTEPQLRAFGIPTFEVAWTPTPTIPR